MEANTEPVSIEAPQREAALGYGLLSCGLSWDAQRRWNHTPGRRAAAGGTLRVLMGSKRTTSTSKHRRGQH
jgi:hypothetical protein